MSELPGLQIMESNILAGELSLAIGRPRMPGYAVFVFLMIRGFLGSLTTKPSRRFLRESMSLYAFLQDRGLDMPAMTTILENVNLVSHSTRDMILGSQIALIIGEELDDFNNLTVDSTAVKANSSWPTDSKILTALPSKEKILSLSDGSAAYIEKGGRNPVIGYKPQLVRSANGFVYALIVPDGNAPDSKQLVPAIADSVRHTCVVPELVSAEDWESKIYSNARRCRSAVESLMFTKG